MSQPFDFNQALKQLQSGQALTGQDGVLMPLIKQLTEAAIKAELEQHLTESSEPNRKNGTTSKTIKTGASHFILDTPRDRAGTFEPQLVKKNQTQLTPRSVPFFIFKRAFYPSENSFEYSKTGLPLFLTTKNHIPS